MVEFGEYVHMKITTEITPAEEPIREALSPPNTGKKE